MKISVKIKNTEGSLQAVELTVVNPKIKTLVAGQTYTAGHLVKLAKGEALTPDDLKESPALRGISKATALEMVIESFKNGSTNLSDGTEEETTEEETASPQGTTIEVPTGKDVVKRSVKK